MAHDSTHQTHVAGRLAAASFVPRFLIWPAAAWAVLQAINPWPGAPVPVPLVAALLAAVAVAASFRIPLRLPALGAIFETVLAGGTVAVMGGSSSPWLLLFPWLALDYGLRGGAGRVVFAAVPAAYACAVIWTGVIPPWQLLLVHGLAFAGTVFYAVIAGPVTPVPTADDGGEREADVIRLQERVLALFGSLAGGDGRSAGGTAPADGARGARALARALHALLSRNGPGRDLDATLHHFDPARLLESACDDWSACARVRGLDVQGHVAFDDRTDAFGDQSRITRILDLLLLAGCFSATSGVIRLKVAVAPEQGSEPALNFILDVDGEPDGEFVAWRVQATLATRARELGGACRADAPPTQVPWSVRLPVELKVQETGDRGRLSGIPLHLAGESVLREVMAHYLAAEGAELVEAPGRSRLILLAQSPRDPETELRCQDLKQSHPGLPVLCLGSGAGGPASLLLEADELVPVPFSRDALVGMVNRHLAVLPRGFGRRPAAPTPRTGPARKAEPMEAGSVLVAEDDAISARVVTRFLEAEGCRVHRVQDGQAALDALMEGGPVLGLLDMHMPGLGGVEVAERLRAWEREQGRDSLPLVALTASAAEADREACREAGMDGFLNKPVDRDALREILAKYLGNEAREITDAEKIRRKSET